MMSAGRRALDTVVRGQTPERLPPPVTATAMDKEPPPPPPHPTQTEEKQAPKPAVAANPQKTMSATISGETPAQVQEDGKGDAAGASSQPPLPPGFQNHEDEWRREADAKKEPGAISKNTPPANIVTPLAKTTSEDAKSTTSSEKSSKRRSKVSSVLSEQIDREMEENIQLEKSRLEENDAQTDADIALLLSKVEDLKMQKKLDKTLHNKKIGNIKKNAAELHAIIDAAEEDNQSVSSSVIVVEEAGDGLEMTAAGAALGGGRPDTLTSEWAKGVAGATSTPKKDVKLQMPPSLPRRSLPKASRKTSKKIDFGAMIKEEKEKKQPPAIPFYTLKDKPIKEKKKLPKKKEEEKTKVKDEKPKAKMIASSASGGLTTAAATKRSPSSSSCSSTSSNTSSIASSSVKGNASSATTNMMAAVVKLQQKQLEASLSRSPLTS